MTARLARKLAAMKAAPNKALSPAFTAAQEERIRALARSIARNEVDGFKRWVGQPTQRRGGCG